MKKWLSLLLAGLTIFSMAATVLADSPVYTAPGCDHDHNGNGYYIIPVIDLSKNPYYNPTGNKTVYCPICTKECSPVYADSNHTIFLGYFCAQHGYVVEQEEEKYYCPKCGKECTPVFDETGSVLLAYYCTTDGIVQVSETTPSAQKAYCPCCGKVCHLIYDSGYGMFLGYYCTTHGMVTPSFETPDDTKVYCPYCGSQLTFVYDKNGLFIGYNCPKHGSVKPVDTDPYKVYCPTCGSQCTLKYTDTTGVIQLGYYCPTHGFVKATTGTSYYYNVKITAGYGGTVKMDKTNPVKAGESRIITITPDYGYAISSVYINGYYYGTTDTIRLDSIYRNYTIQVKFRKVDTQKRCTITTNVVGNGSVYAVVNDQNIGTVEKLSVSYADSVELRFVPAEGHYSIANVVVNGVSKGALSSLYLKRFSEDTTVSVQFQWNNPYSDVTTHLSAVEYVTEVNIMGSPNTHIAADKFMGSSTVSLRAFAAYLAELADVTDSLDTVAERIAWAKNAGIITDSDKLSKVVTVREAASLVEKYVRYLEKANNMTFADLKNVSGAENVGIAIGYLTSTTYQNNASLTRYDMAEICYGISLLD